MQELMIFSNPEFGEIRTVEINGEPWFVGKDVAVALGYENPARAIRSHVDEDDKGVTKLVTPGGTQDVIIINESGVYSLILSSKLPTAKKFKHWVTAEVLPSIRKNGGYIQGQKELSPEELMAKALVVAQKTLAEREARISALTVENQIMAPKASYFDDLVDRNLLTGIRETAKEIGASPKKFVNFLLERKYLYRDQKGKLMPYQPHVDSGLFELKECINEKTQWGGTQTMVTPKGRETFRLLCVEAS